MKGFDSIPLLSVCSRSPFPAYTLILYPLFYSAALYLIFQFILNESQPTCDTSCPIDDRFFDLNFISRDNENS